VSLPYLLFGSVLPTYSSFVHTIESLFSLALGDFDFHALNIAQPVLGPLFFFLFIAIIFIGMQTMFLTIICEAFTMVRGNLEYQKNDYEIVDYVMNKFKGLFGITDRYRFGNQSERLTRFTNLLRFNNLFSFRSHSCDITVYVQGPVRDGQKGRPAEPATDGCCCH